MSNFYTISPIFLDSTRVICRWIFPVLCIVLFAVCTVISPAYAHKVNIFAYAQSGKVHAEGYFADGTKCKNSVIEVIDNKTGQKLLEGRTDDNGQYSFDIPQATAMKLILRAGIGHQNEYVLSEEEVMGAMPLLKKRTEKQAGQQKSTAPEPKLMKKEQAAGIQNATNLPGPDQDLEEVVGKVVDSKLQPVMRILVKLQEQSEKPGLTEIIGGIGYIIGIMGIIGYLKGRAVRRQNKSS
jgi:nickel transport protein